MNEEDEGTPFHEYTTLKWVMAGILLFWVAVGVGIGWGIWEGITRII